ncbi:MAG TPA: aspartate aminotransferase family protein [Candidatus Limnocylindrales bacterium]|nr:aspartate aminotransferase family protein [Candidatus Limnocylindrales bacterium]
MTASDPSYVSLDRQRLEALMARELAAFETANPRSRALWERAKGSLLAGVPMNWMGKWAGGFPLFVDRASGARFTDVDGHEYVDLCLGDTGSMTGHGPAATIRAVEAQLPRGITHMLPTEDAIAVGEELQRRFGLRWWQFTLSATDANRFAIRLARMITGRPKVLFHELCYHGSVDESFAWLDDAGEVVARRGNIGPGVDPALTTRIVPFNDLGALERELAHGDVAVAVMEPALTNVGIVLPDPDYHAGVRELTRRHGTLLLIDETHTICAGPGGYTREHGLDPDLLVIGKSIGGGIPCGTYGFTEEIGDRITEMIEWDDQDVGGVGGTLAGYALSMAAMRATLAEVLTEEAFARMIPLAERWAAGVDEVLRSRRVPWHVTRLGARAEYHFMPELPRNGRDQWDNGDTELERFLHLYAMNRGILMTPFHNMALMSPATTEADVDRHTEVFASAVDELFG